MEIRIKAIHFDATAKLEEFINKKAQKLARRNESVTGFDVTLKVVKPETAMNKEASIKPDRAKQRGFVCLEGGRHV